MTIAGRMFCMCVFFVTIALFYYVTLQALRIFPMSIRHEATMGVGVLWFIAKWGGIATFVVWILDGPASGVRLAVGMVR